MLKNIIVQNFVYFRDKQTLDFTYGPYLFVGENDTGKSSLFEIIRRCMSIKKSTGLTKPHDPSLQSIAMCIFQHNDENIKRQVVATYIRPFTKEKRDLYIKLVYVGRPDHTQLEEIGIEIIKESIGKLCWMRVDNGDLKNKLQHADNNPDQILKIVCSHMESVHVDEELFVSGDTPCETLLKKYVNKAMVVTFPLRSISPCQWTKSKRLKHERKKDNTDEAYLKEEIVSWYLKKYNEEKISEEECKLEKKYFQLITNERYFSFKYDEKTQRIYAENKAFYDSKPFPIPEGIYEAKKLSIMLALKRFKTVCLEDPERGMHPQMIDRVRDLVLTPITDKVVLLISHNPSFISPSTIPKVYYFRASFNNDRRVSNIISTLKETAEPDDDKTSRIITSGKSPFLFYAKRPILVEGDGDYLFLTALKQLLLTDKDIFEKYLELALSRNDGSQVSSTERSDEEGFKQFLCSLHVLPMVGEANKHRYREICSHHQITSYFLMDKDALFQNNPGQTDQNSPKRFLELFGFSYDDEMCKSVLKDVGVLECEGVFLWKAGTIEHMAVQLALVKNLRDFFEENNVFLNYDIIAEKSKENIAEQADVNVSESAYGDKTQPAGDLAGITEMTPTSEKSTDKQSDPKKGDGHTVISPTKDKEEKSKVKHESKKAGDSKSKKKFKRKPKNKRKIFNDERLTNENIDTVVKKITNVSLTYQDSDCRRLVLFLFEMYRKSSLNQNNLSEWYIIYQRV